VLTTWKPEVVTVWSPYCVTGVRKSLELSTPAAAPDFRICGGRPNSLTYSDNPWFVADAKSDRGELDVRKQPQAAGS
jgi:hypothetical protein